MYEIWATVTSMETTKLSEIIDYITGKLRCSRRSLAILINIDKNTITNNADKTLQELTLETGKKIGSLYYILNRYLPAHDSDAIHKVLKAHVYKNYTGETDSVISSIQQSKYELETLGYIVQTARDEYEEQLREESPVNFEDVAKTLLYA